MAVDDRPVDRLSASDLTQLATDRGPAPMHLAAVLLLEGAADDGHLLEVLLSRAARVPRLRQRLVRPPLGRGRPYWLDDAAVDLRGHVQQVELPTGAGWMAMLDAAAAAVCAPLDRREPLWRASWITGWDPTPARRGALVVVLHHVLMDGIGGLLLLGRLVDGAAAEVDPADRAPMPELGSTTPIPTTATSRQLVADATRARVAALRAAPRTLARAVHGVRELGVGATRPRLAARTSLNRPTGPSRRLAAVDLPLAAVVERAHAASATVNDVVVSAVVGALERLLARRGERPRSLVVSVPISSRAPGEGGAGNHTGVLPVEVPTGLDAYERLEVVAARTAARRGGSRGSSAVPLGAAFRLLGRLGVFRSFVEHQRLVHTFETNVRGPAQPLHLAGHTVGAIVPVAVNPGNVGVSFAVLSYAERLVVTLVADPLVVPDLEVLARVLAEELGGAVLQDAFGLTDDATGLGTEG